MSDELSAGGVWQQDPFGRYGQRWWNGAEWTDQVTSPEGAVVIDPLGAAPGPADATGVLPPPSPFGAPAPLPPTAYTPGFQQPGYQQMGYQQPGVGAWAPPQQMGPPNTSATSGMAIASMILGIGALLVALVPILGLISVPFAVAGLGLGIAGIVRASKGFGGKGMSIAGLLTSIAALVVSVLYLSFFASVANDSDGFNTDPSNGICNQDRFWQDPDC